MKRDFKELKVGRKFDIYDYDGKRLLLREWTRTILTAAVLLACLAALGLAAIVFDPNGESNTVLKVWGVVSVPISGILGYYLKGTKQSAEGDD